MSRIVSALGAGALALCLLLFAAACNSSADGSTADPVKSADGADAGFPTEVDSVNGPVAIESRPERVALLTDQLVETAAAIGVTPIAGPEPTTPLGPWAEGSIDQDNADVFSLPLTDGVPVEKIAAADPDLIVASDYFVDETTYDKLSKVAPTLVLAVNTEDGSTPAWESNALAIGRATGHLADAEQVIGSINAEIDQLKQEYPQIAGKTFQLGNFLSDSEFVCTNSEQTSSSMFLSSLGLELARIPGAGDEPRVVLPKERFSDLNEADLVIMGASDDELAGKLADDPIFSRLTPVQRQTANLVDLTWVTAYNIPTALSIPYLLDDLLPYLERL